MTVTSTHTAADVPRWRDARRAELLAARIAVSLIQRRQWNQRVTQHLATCFPVLKGAVVGGYWPFRAEFDPRFLMRQWRHCGALTALPVVVRKQAPLQFRAWWPGAPTVKAALGLQVPDGTDLVTPDVLLIPPVGFDDHGYRLGYGGGYFDRTLAAMQPQPLKIGVGFELSHMATIHPQAHDVPMDFIVTEAGVYRVEAEGLVMVQAPGPQGERISAIATGPRSQT